MDVVSGFASAGYGAIDPARSAGAREMVAIAFKQRWLIVLGLVLPPLIALVLVLVLPKVYRAESDILVKTGREYLAQTDGESGMTAPSSTKQEGINSEIALLGSRAVAEGAIRAIGIEAMYPDLLESPPLTGSVLDAAVVRFGKDLTVEAVKLSNVISVSFDAADPELAKRVLDTTIRIYIAKHTQVFAGSRTEGYSDSIAHAMEEIRGLEEHRSSIKLGNGIYDIVVQRQAIIGQRTDAQNKLLDALTREAKLTAKIRYLETARAQIPATTSSVSTDQNDEAIHARDAMIDLRQQELALATRYGAANPELARVRSQIAGLQHKVEGTSLQRNKVTTAPSPVRQAVEQEVLMDRAELNTLAGEIERLRQVVEERDGELQRLERADLDLRSTVLRIDVLTDNLRAMQGRYEQARAQEQTELAHQVSVVQVAAALASEKPVKPKKLIFGLVGGLGALLTAGGIALFGILVNKTAVTEDAAERLLGMKVLAVLPMHKRPRRSPLGAA